MAELQTAHHEPLNLLAAVRWPDEDEVKIHRALAAERLVGEWFKPEGELVRWVVELMRDFDSYHLVMSRLDPERYPPPCDYVNQSRLYWEENKLRVVV